MIYNVSNMLPLGANNSIFIAESSYHSAPARLRGGGDAVQVQESEAQGGGDSPDKILYEGKIIACVMPMHHTMEKNLGEVQASSVEAFMQSAYGMDNALASPPEHFLLASGGGKASRTGMAELTIGDPIKFKELIGEMKLAGSRIAFCNKDCVGSKTVISVRRGAAIAPIIRAIYQAVAGAKVPAPVDPNIPSRGEGAAKAGPERRREPRQRLKS